MSIISMPGVARERVEVHDDQIERLDAVLVEVGAVLGIVAVGQDAAVHLGMQRHDTVAEDRRVAGEVGDVGDGEARLAQRAGGAAARDEIPAQLVQARPAR